MIHVSQSALTMLRRQEWMPVTAARVLIGIFFCISGGTKLFGKGQFGVFEKTMVQIRVPFPYATAMFVASVEFACGAGLAIGAACSPLCLAAMLMRRHDRRDRDHFDTAYDPGRAVLQPGSTDFLYRPEVPIPVVDPVVWLIFSGDWSIQRRWLHRLENPAC